MSSGTLLACFVLSINSMLLEIYICLKIAHQPLQRHWTTAQLTSHFAATILGASLRLYLLLRCGYTSCFTAAMLETSSFKHSRSEALTTLETPTLTQTRPSTQNLRTILR